VIGCRSLKIGKIGQLAPDVGNSFLERVTAHGAAKRSSSRPMHRTTDFILISRPVSARQRLQCRIRKRRGVSEDQSGFHRQFREADIMEREGTYAIPK